MKNKALLISFVLIFFVMLTAVSASDDIGASDIDNSDNLLSADTNVAQDLSSQDISSDDNKDMEATANQETDDLSAEDNKDVETNIDKETGESEVLTAQKKATVTVTSPKTIKNGQDFSVKVIDGDGKPITDKIVAFSVNGKYYEKTTGSDGVAKLPLSLSSGYYKVYYTFKQTGYTHVKGNTEVLVISKTQSVLKGSNYVAYTGFKNPYKVTLRVNGIALANKQVKFKINGKSYYATTDANGKATLNIKDLKNGKYKIKYLYYGEKNIKGSYGKSKLYVKKMTTKIYRNGAIDFTANVKGIFKVKVIDARGNPAKGKVAFKLNGQKQKVRTDDKGIAYIKVKLPKGVYKVKYTFYENSLYKSVYSSKKIIVRPLNYNNNHGYWCFGADMKKVNLNQLANLGTKHIFLNFMAVNYHGTSGVKNFALQAASKGIKVHMWMQVCYDGSWVDPVSSDGSFKYSFINSKVKEAKKYASIKGIAGVHLDYIRYPGTAYHHSNSAAAITYMTKQIAEGVHGVNKNLIVSAAVMPEVSGNKYYYGQDISAMSKYVDALVPMVYKGNYNAGTSWIKSTTAAFVKMSKGAEIWTGLQSYNSDDDVSRLSYNSLFNDAKAAMSGGANGVIIFRWGITEFLNFNKL